MNYTKAELMFERALNMLKGTESAVFSQWCIFEEQVDRYYRQKSFFQDLTAQEFYQEYFCVVFYNTNLRIDILESKRFIVINKLFRGFDPMFFSQESSDLIETSSDVFRKFSDVFRGYHREMALGYVRGCRQIEQDGFDNFKERLLEQKDRRSRRSLTARNARTRKQGLDILEELPWIGTVRKHYLAKAIGLSGAHLTKDNSVHYRLLTHYARLCFQGNGWDEHDIIRDEENMVDEFTSHLAEKYSKNEYEISRILTAYCIGKIIRS